MDSTTCLYFLMCQCCTKPPYKKLVDGIYPPNTTGYETHLSPVNEDRLAKYALKNSKMIPDILTYMSQLILKHLRKEKKGYVFVGVEALKTLIESCHSEISVIEQYVFSLMRALFEATSDIDYQRYALTIFHLIVLYKPQEQDVDVSFSSKFEVDICEACQYVAEDPNLMLSTRILGLRCLYRYLCILSSHGRSLFLPYCIPIILQNMNRSTLVATNDPRVLKLVNQAMSYAERCWFEISSNLEGTENVFVTQFFGYLDTMRWSDVSFINRCIDTIIDAQSTVGIPIFFYLLRYLSEKERNLFLCLHEDVLSICFAANEKEKAVEAAENNNEINIYSMNINEDINILHCSLYALQKEPILKANYIDTPLEILLILYIYMIVYNVENREEWNQLKLLARENIVTLTQRVSGAPEFLGILRLLKSHIDDDIENLPYTELVSLFYTLTTTRYLDDLSNLPMELFYFILYNFKYTEADIRFFYMKAFDNLLQDSNHIYPEARLTLLQIPYLYSSLYLTLLEPSNTYDHLSVLLKILLGILSSSLKDHLCYGIQLIFKLQHTFLLEEGKEKENIANIANYFCSYNENGGEVDSNQLSSSFNYILSLENSSLSRMSSKSGMAPKSLLPFTQSGLCAVQEEEEEENHLDTLNESLPSDSDEEKEFGKDQSDVLHLEEKDQLQTSSDSNLVDKQQLETEGEMNLDQSDEIPLEDTPSYEESASLPSLSSTTDINDKWIIHTATGYPCLIHSFISDYFRNLAQVLNSNEIREYTENIIARRRDAKWEICSFEGTVADQYTSKELPTTSEEDLYCDSSRLFFNRTYIVSCILRSPVFIQSQLSASYADSLKEDFSLMKTAEENMSASMSFSSMSLNKSFRSYDGYSTVTGSVQNDNDDETTFKGDDASSITKTQDLAKLNSFSMYCEHRQRSIDHKKEIRQSIIQSVLPDGVSHQRGVSYGSKDQENVNFELLNMSVSKSSRLNCAVDASLTINQDLHTVI